MQCCPDLDLGCIQYWSPSVWALRTNAHRCVDALLAIADRRSPIASHRDAHVHSCGCSGLREVEHVGALVVGGGERRVLRVIEAQLEVHEPEHVRDEEPE